jgi:hypothetical protein
VDPADALELIVGKGLDADGYAVYPGVSTLLKQFAGGGFRVYFNRDFNQLREFKRLPDTVDEVFERFGPEQTWCASSQVESLEG